MTASNATELLAALTDRRGTPVGVHLQVADRCNHKCVHCYQVQGLKGELDQEQLFALLRKLADAGVLLLSVSGGEATLRDDLVPLLRYARSLGFALRLYTNGFACSDELCDELAAVGLLEVHVSLYSADPAQHDAVTRVPGSWLKTTATMRGLRARGVRVLLKAPALATAAGAMSGLRALAEDWGCVFVPSMLLTPREDGALAPLEEQVSPAALAREGMLKPWVPPHDHEAAQQRKLSAGSCGVGSSGVVVLSNGDVLPCTDTPVVLGNLVEQGFDEVVGRGSSAHEFAGLRWADVHGCRDCELLLACNRCHATALHTSGDYLGPYEGACERARARYELGVGRPLELLGTVEGEARNPLVGPYRIVEHGVLSPVMDRISEGDDERAARVPALRKSVQRGTGASSSTGLVPVTRLTARAVRALAGA